jgi:polysaccharide pyruvyl transferase WcaK-like protein
MSEHRIKILCPEYVPLENKGEEAIIQGVIDVLNIRGECEYHIVDNNASTYYYKNGLHVHPGALFFSDWRSREFQPGFSFSQIYSSLCAITRHALNILYPKWVSKPHKEARKLKSYLAGDKIIPPKYVESLDKLKGLDYVIAGHNGGLDEYVCHLLSELRDIGIPNGIYGSSMKPNVTGAHLLAVYEKAFEQCEYIITRNPIGLKWARENFPKIEFSLSPDPAFGMHASSPDEVSSVIEKLGLKEFFSKPVIFLTTAEPAPIRRHAFNAQRTISGKVDAHRNLLAQILSYIHKTYSANVMFLPHTIGPSKSEDDRVIANDVIKRAGFESDKRVLCLEENLSAKELKGIIRLGELIIAERVHSVIGAIGVCTPFILLSSKNDNRGLGIIDKQLNLGDYIQFLNHPSLDKIVKLIDKVYLSRFIIREELAKKNNQIKAEIELSVEQIKKRLPIK